MAVLEAYLCLIALDIGMKSFEIGGPETTLSDYHY